MSGFSMGLSPALRSWSMNESHLDFLVVGECPRWDNAMEIKTGVDDFLPRESAAARPP